MLLISWSQITKKKIQDPANNIQYLRHLKPVQGLLFVWY